MTKNQRADNSKPTRNYWVNAISFLPFLLLLISGIIMLLYHTGRPYPVETIGLNGDTWLVIHMVLSIIAVPFVVLHLYLHFDWLKKLFAFKLKNKHKRKNITLFVIFTLCVLTSLFSLFIVPDSNVRDGLRGIHNKLGLIMLVFFAIHIVNYFKWIVSMTYKVLRK